ncbi:MAG: sugar-binding protein [Desulfobacterales bacterium]|jgi:RHS repeat-associated protein|nr:sugar-binding protein [Desulfobacterales bacterium]
MFKRLLSLFIALFICLPVIAHSSENRLFDKTVQIRRFHVHHSLDRFRADAETGILKITKNTPEKKIYNGFVKINNKLIRLRHFLKSNDVEFEKQIKLRSKNRLQIFLLGAPGASITITVSTQGTSPQPEINFSASPQSILPEESSTLSWTSTDADAVIIDNGIGNVDLNGSMTVFPSATTTYTITASGSGGTDIARAAVTVTYPEPEALINVTPTIIISGESCTLTWSTENAETVSIDNGIGSVDLNGSISVSPTETITYNVTATGQGGITTDSVTVTVIYPPGVTITALSDTIGSGSTTSLSWNSNHSDSVIVEPDIGSVTLNGSTDVSPKETTTYTITASGPGGTISDSVTVTVIPPPEVTFTATPNTIGLGTTSILSWNSTYADTVIIDNGIGSVDVNGTMTVSPSETTTFTIIATGQFSSTTKEVTITVYGLEIVKFNVDTPIIMRGSSATLSWTSENATSCTIDNGIGEVALSGSITVTPSETTTFTITASDMQNTVTAELTITVVDTPIVNLTVDNTAINKGESVTLSWTSENATSCTIDNEIGAVDLNGSLLITPNATTTYTIIASNQISSASNSISVIVTWPEPGIYFSATPQQIISPGSSTLSWTTTNATSVSIDNGIGSVALNGSFEVNPSETTTYIITASNPDLSVTAQQVITVTHNPPQVADFSVSNSEINYGDSVTLSWNVQNAESIYISNGIGEVASSGSMVIMPDYTTTWHMTAFSKKGGLINADTYVKVLGNPPGELPEGSFGEIYQDIVPEDASLESYDEKRFIILTGIVNDINGNPLSGVKVEIFTHPEYGSVLTDSDGRFSIPAEGGKLHTLIYTKIGYLTSHRQKKTPWNDIVVVDNIALIDADTASTEIVFDGNPETIVTHKSTEIIDPEFGNRSCTMIFSGDNIAYEVDKNGNRVNTLSTITTRATEYTTIESMPSELPPTSAFTYCAELSVDGVQRVQFDKPVIMYVDNFLDFQVGGIVPVGYYYRDKGQWVASENGVIVELLDTDSDGIVDALDSTDDGNPNDLNDNGVFSDEVTGLGDSDVYAPGSRYWRVSVRHFTPFDLNWPYGPPEDAEYPDPEIEPDTDSDDPVCFGKGTLVHISNGLIPIEEISIGDRVWSYDENSDEIKFNSVSRIYVTPNQKLIELKIQSDEGVFEIFRVTSEHIFKVINRGWISASELRPEDIISSINGKTTIFKSFKKLPGTETVYNIEVENAHSYFVGENGLLVHNACSGNVDPKKRVLQQDIPIPGTGMTLHYTSNRIDTAFKQIITVPASGSSIPASLLNITVKLDFAGRSFTETLSALPNQKAKFVFDSKDFLGNSLSGKVKATVSVGYNYGGVYNAPWSSISSGGGLSQETAFGRTGGASISGDGTRRELTLWRHYSVPVNIPVFPDEIAEGWALSSHHRQNPADSSTLYRGDGTNTQNSLAIITTVAGTGSHGYSGDGGAATEARLHSPHDVAVDKDGNLFVADYSNNRIRKIDKNGIITTVVGGGGSREDGVPATEAELDRITGITLDRSDNLFLSTEPIDNDYGHNMRMVDTNGIITTVAGKRTGGWIGDYNGDGMPATEVDLQYLNDVAIDEYGNFFFLGGGRGNYDRVFMVNGNGIISTVAGTGYDGYSGDGGPATEAQVYTKSVAIDDEGNIYISDTYNHRIRKVDNAGIITTVAGTGTIGYNGDGGLATEAKLNHPRGLVLDPEGNLFIADSHNYCIRKVDTSGTITTIIGTGASGYSGDGGPATEAELGLPFGLALDSEGYLFIADMWRDCIRKVGLPLILSGVMGSGDNAFGDANGFGYITDSTGKHQKTIDLETGNTLLEFRYEGNKLRYIIDQFGKQIEIKYVDQNNVEIISPYGLKTSLTIDENNYLEKVTYPDQNFYEFVYTNDGLMEWITDPEQNRCDYSYDNIGRLTDAFDSEGGHWNYTRNFQGDGNVQTVITTGEGNQTTSIDHTYSTGRYTSINTKPSGDVSESEGSHDGLSISISELCGMGIDLKYSVDSEFQYKYLTDEIQTSLSGLTRTISINKIYEDTNSDDIPDLITETKAINGKTTTLAHNILTSTKIITTPENRTVTSIYNLNTLQTENVSVPGLNDVTYEYYPTGHIHYGKLHYIVSGDRTTEYSYYDNGDLYTITDPEEKVTTYEEYDLLGRVKRVKRPDNTIIQYEYDNNGNMTVLTNPSGEIHQFGFNGVGLKDSYITPHPRNYSYQYDKEKRLVNKLFPSGKEIIYDYDDGTGDKSLLRHIITPEVDIDYAYSCGSKLESVTNGNDYITWGYDGSIITSQTFTGTLNQTLTYTYNNDGDFDLDRFTYAGTTETYNYDNDGLITGVGNYTISRKPDNGLPDKVSKGDFSLERSFNNYGKADGENYLVNSVSVGSWDVISRDLAGRILEKTETIAGMTDTYNYTYDDNGRLETAAKNNVIVETYDYSNVPYGTCTYRTNDLRGISSEYLSYDEEDRLLNTDDTSYTYNEDGYLTTKVKGTETTSYSYSSRGELQEVTLPDNTVIGYVHDPLGRRIAKKVNGTITEKYLWYGATTLLAIYDGSDNLMMRFEYTDSRTPISMVKGGILYYCIYDQVGTLKAVIDSAGIVIKTIEYDTFGYILNDSDETFEIPFGFAGGLYDQDTRLVRFGARDYDPEIGRWTAKDPIGFAGGDSDLYGYVLNDPVNLIDPLGLKLTDRQNAGITMASSIASIAASAIGTPAAGAVAGALVGGLSSIALGGDFADIVNSVASGALGGYLGGLIGNLGKAASVIRPGASAGSFFAGLGLGAILYRSDTLINSPCE